MGGMVMLRMGGTVNSAEQMLLLQLQPTFWRLFHPVHGRAFNSAQQMLLRQLQPTFWHLFHPVQGRAFGMSSPLLYTTLRERQALARREFMLWRKSALWRMIPKTP